MKLTGTRTYLEVRVGTFHTAEILLHVRRQDLSWFNHQHADGTQQLFSLLQHSILPRMFASEIEISHAKQTGSKLPPPLGPGGIPIEVGETHLKQKQQGKRKRQLSKKQIAAELVRQQENDDKKEKDVYYAFGTSIQLAYRLEDDAKRKPPVTLVFRGGLDDTDDPDSKNDDNAGNSSTTAKQQKRQDTMHHLIKLSKRVVLWLSPYDPTMPMEPDHPGGMPRPDMIPLADLFRQSTTHQEPRTSESTATRATKATLGVGYTRFFCLLALLAIAAADTCNTPSVHRASQLAIGEWDLFLKCSRDIYESLIFPHTKTTAPATLMPRLSWDLSREYPCRLSMFSNGTFSLEPRLDQTPSSSNLNSFLACIHGKWEALPNPYCATDRYYDELVFCSNNRVERQLPRASGLLPWTKKNDLLLKKIRFRLSCRLHGQYWSSDGRAAFHAFGKKTAFTVGGRLSHGVLVTDQMDGADKPVEWWRRRVVTGSFVGFRCRPMLDQDDDDSLS